MWSAINAIAAEALPKDRAQAREIKMEILASLGTLIRTRRVLRWKRTKLAILDACHEIIPLENIRASTA